MFNDVTQYIGYTYSELKRADINDKSKKFPLIDFKMTEKDVTEFLQERNIWNPLYKHFTRTGCFLCPKQKKEAFFNIWKHYKDEWNIMLEYEKKCNDIGAYNQTFNINKTLIELEQEFKIMDQCYLVFAEYEMTIKDLQKYTDEITATRIMYLLKENNLESVSVKVHKAGNKLNQFRIKEAHDKMRQLCLESTNKNNGIHFDIYYGYLEIIKNMIEEGEE